VGEAEATRFEAERYMVFVVVLIDRFRAVEEDHEIGAGAAGYIGARHRRAAEQAQPCKPW
jgi:hypothetical protein